MSNKYYEKVIETIIHLISFTKIDDFFLPVLTYCYVPGVKGTTLHNYGL